MTQLALLDTTAAVEQLRNGQVIAYPTEAVYGLGCDPRNEAAVRNILRIKGRHESMGLVLIASDFKQIQPWIGEVEERLVQTAMDSWPGPVTWLFPRAADVPDYVAGSHPTVAVRVTAHQPSRDLCEAFGSALISTSANFSAASPARSYEEVDKNFRQLIAGCLEGDLGDGERPSEIRDLRTGNVLRQG